MILFFKSLKCQGFALLYIHDTLLMSNFKQQILQILKQRHHFASEIDLNLANDESFFLLLIVKKLGHDLGCAAVMKIAENHEVLHLLTKIEPMKLLGSMKFHSKIVHKLHDNVSPLYILLHDNIEFHSNKKLETLIQQNETSTSFTCFFDFVSYNSCISRYNRRFPFWYGLCFILNELQRKSGFKFLNFRFFNNP